MSIPDEASQTSGMPTADPLVGTLVADRYRIEALLGEGAMGAVYRAEHVHMKKTVALKVLHRQTSTNAEVVRRFEREAVAAGRVEHPNVAAATDFGRLADGSFYLVLEYVAGASLGRIIEEEAPLSPERACRIARQIAAALAAAHAAGIVHRDLKPENVMSVGQNRDALKVLDFGMAKLAQGETADDTKLTMHGAVYGTPQYMAPEQAAGQEVDHRADLYAVGVMLYEMLTGTAPFTADQVMPLLIKHMTEPPPPLPTELPRELVNLVMTLLAKKPEQRIQTAAELEARLRHFLGEAKGASGDLSSAAPAHSTLSLPRMTTLLAAAGPMANRASELARRSIHYLRGTTEIRGRAVPRWAAAGAIALPLMIVPFAWGDPEGEATPPSPALQAGSTAAADASPEPPPLEKPSRKEPPPPDPQLAKVIAAAQSGSEPALYALEQRDDDERSSPEWLALAKARLMRKRVEPALEAFQAAIEMRPESKNDDTMLGALRKLADDETHAPPILTFAAERMGQLGADFLFHVWSKTSRKTPSTTMAYDLLTDGDVKKNWSAGLRVAMELRDLESCEDYRTFLPRVQAAGDERSLTRLRDLMNRGGCGKSKRDDCYPCLRDDDALIDAMQEAGMRKAPRFDRPRRWRFR